MHYDDAQDVGTEPKEHRPQSETGEGNWSAQASPNLELNVFNFHYLFLKTLLMA